MPGAGVAAVNRPLVASALAFGATVPARRMALYAFAVCLSVPLVVGTVAGVEMPLAILAIVMALPFYPKVPGIAEKQALTMAVGLALSAGIWTVVADGRGSPLRLAFSAGYFFAPYLTFFAGYCLLRRHDDLVRVLGLMSWIFALVAALITASLVADGLPVRIERIGRMGEYIGPGSALAGSLLGLPLYATWGVISLAVFYATMLAVVCVRLRYLPPRDPIAFLGLAGGLVCLLYLVAGALSRTVATGVTVFVVIFLSDILRGRQARRWILGAMIPLGLGLVVVALLFGQRVLASDWSALARRNVASLQAARLDAFTSGRLVLVAAAVQDLADRPFTGSGFGGFREGIDKYNSSPHNQYLTAAWKMGLPAAIFYFLFLYRCVANLYRLKQAEDERSIYHGLWALVMAYGLGFCLTWDVFLVPITGAFLMFLFGGFARLVRVEATSERVPGEPAAL